MWLKLTLNYKIKYNKQNLVHYRIHDSNSSSINWTKIVEDNYKSLDSIMRHTHNDQQKIAIIYKRFILSKELIIINKKLPQKELVAFFMKLYILIQSHKSIDIAINRFIDGLLDHLLIYFFKRNSFAARKAKKRLKHRFNLKFLIFSLLFSVGNLSKRFDYYILLIANYLFPNKSPKGKDYINSFNVR